LKGKVDEMTNLINKLENKMPKEEEKKSEEEDTLDVKSENEDKDKK
jgi:hypothetical protein